MTVAWRLHDTYTAVTQRLHDGYTTSCILRLDNFWYILPTNLHDILEHYKNLFKFTEVEHFVINIIYSRLSTPVVWDSSFTSFMLSTAISSTLPVRQTASKFGWSVMVHPSPSASSASPGPSLHWNMPCHTFQAPFGHEVVPNIEHCSALDGTHTILQLVQRHLACRSRWPDDPEQQDELLVHFQGVDEAHLRPTPAPIISHYRDLDLPPPLPYHNHKSSKLTKLDSFLFRESSISTTKAITQNQMATDSRPFRAGLSYHFARCFYTSNQVAPKPHFLLFG